MQNRFIVLAKSTANIDDLVEQIMDLAKSEKRPDVKILDTMPVVGVAVVQCDETFAKKMSQLAAVDSIDEDRLAAPAMKRPPKGPMF